MTPVLTYQTAGRVAADYVEVLLVLTVGEVKFGLSQKAKTKGLD